MEKFTELFQEFLLKAITLTEETLAREVDDIQLAQFTENRDRLYGVIDQISRQIDWQTISSDKKEEFNRQIDYMKKLDEQMLVKLQEYQIELKKEIEQTHRQKANVKGYNLNDLK
jgi:hypothetical protein